MPYEIEFRRRSNGQTVKLIPFYSFGEFQKAKQEIIQRHGLQEIVYGRRRTEKRYAKHPHGLTGVVMITRENNTRPETRAIVEAARLFE